MRPPRDTARHAGKLADRPEPRPAEPAAALESPPALDVGEIVTSIGEAPYVWRIDTDALTWGRNAAELLAGGDAARIATGRAYAELAARDNTQSRFDAVMKSTARDDDGGGVRYQVQYCLRPDLKSDAKLWIEDTGCWFAGEDGKPLRAHGVVRIINERYEREQHLSQFDTLTGELNRWSLTKTLDAIVQDALRFRSSCGFLLIAIDNLANINAAYGFDAADEVIATVAKRIRARMRGGDFLGRVSGNKFGVILKEATPEAMAVAADRLLAGVREEVVTTAAGPIATTATIGGIAAPRHARSASEILARVQETLESAKAKRPGSFLAYRPNAERDALRRESARSTDEIIAALNERRILLTYEPVVDARTRRPAFYECLMRLQRPDGSLAPAQEVIPFAERLGFVRLLDHRVLELVVAELAAAPGARASLNVSAASTTDPDWWAGLGALLQRHAGVAERLTVEITETAAIHDVDDTRGFVSRVKDLGCRIAIDDFGAGATSFRNLRKLGADMVKIDGACVQNLTASEDDRAFVHTLIDLARRLRLETVAEWVQDEKAAALLADWGCNYLQGSLIGRASLERPWDDPAARGTGTA